MRNRKLLALWAVLLVFTMACGLTSTISNLTGGGGNSNAVTTIWSDVPLMDGMEYNKVDLPLPARLAFQTMVHSSTNGKDQLQFITYTTTHTISEVSDFYSTDKMTASGWNEKDQAGCQGSDGGTGTSGGGVCYFAKHNADNSGAYLIIFMSQDDKTQKTTVVYMRVDAKEMPTQQP